MNPVLQLMYMMGDIRSAALVSQRSSYHHANPLSFWAELGMLFHMINMVSDAPPTVPKVVSATNFQLSFRRSSEAVALGLIETSSSGATIDSQQAVQVFLKFLLSQLQRETEMESRHLPPAVVDSPEGPGDGADNPP